MVIAVIPSRYQSSRFPGKALIPLNGIPLVVRVAQRVACSGVVDHTLVATDDERIASAVRAAGLTALVCKAPYRSGSDRVAGAIGELGLGEIILNVQGDEPLVTTTMLRGALAALAGNEIGTVAVRAAGETDITHPDLVKVKMDPRAGRALDFSRLSFIEEGLIHLGIYSFYRHCLARFAGLPSSAREHAERLEQLRALEAGMSIGVQIVEGRATSINRAEDVQRVEALL